MQDIAQFRLVRRPRRPDLSETQELVLGGPLITELTGLFKQGDTLDSTAVQNALAAFQSSNADPLDYALGDLPSDGTPLHAIAVLLGELEPWLADHQDRPDGSDLLAELTQLSNSFTAVGASWNQALSDFSSRLADWLALWATQRNTARAATGARYALVAALWAQDEVVSAIGGAAGAQPQGPDETWDLLNRRVVIFPPSFVACFPEARVTLARQATVSDLQVVRSEWRGYVPGEIAMIRNVMAGETFEQIDKQTNETETTQTFDTQTMTQKQTEVQQTDESDLSRQVNTQLGISVQGYLDTTYQQNSPGYSLSVNAGVSGGVQIGRSESLATTISRQAVTRAVASVQTTTREVRSQRTLIKTEETLDHKFDSMAENRRGVYRWVDRVDRFQVFTYPNRLQLEFELPEPAEYVRWRTASLRSASSDPPPPWDHEYLDANIIPDDPKALTAVAAHYRAANLPVLPDKTVSVVTSANLEPKDMPQDFGSPQWNPPTIVDDIEIPIPDGYVATSVSYSGHVTPLRGNWHREQTAHSGADNQDAFHSIAASVAIGSVTKTYFQFGPDSTNENTIMQPLTPPPQPQYEQAMLNIPSAAVGVPLNPPATGKLTVGVRSAGAGTVSMTFTVVCQRSAQTEAAWRSAVYDALFAAWSDWNRTFQSAQQNAALTSDVPVGESSPARNEEVARNELKRQVIEWLLGESPFQGRPGLLAPPAGPPPVPPNPWRDINLSAALETAPVIQFMEEAFEWANLTYVFYPYYWAGRKSWDALNDVTAVDPAYESFLKAGSARVIVPVRPGLEAAVHHWLLYQEPFLGRPMPIPGDPMYVSVATEIRDLVSPTEDGIPGESWEAQIGTTFLWLDDSGSPLPTNPMTHLGAPPKEPKETLYPPVAQT